MSGCCPAHPIPMVVPPGVCDQLARPSGLLLRTNLSLVQAPRLAGGMPPNFERQRLLSEDQHQAVLAVLQGQREASAIQGLLQLERSGDAGGGSGRPFW